MVAMAAEDKSVQQMQQAGARLLQGTQGLAEKVIGGASPGSTMKANRGSSRPPGGDDGSTIADLQRKLNEEQDKNRSLEDQMKHRVASFVMRESQTKNKIEALERRLNSGTDYDEHKKRMSVIENMHKSIVGGLECIQNNTAKVLQDQEKDLMRAFRARLQDVSKELEAQRSRKGEHSTELKARHRRVVAELHEAQELAQTFDRKNQQLAAENQKLQERLRTREDDRAAYLKELMLARKEANKLKQQIKEMEEKESSAKPSKNATDGKAEQRQREFSQKQMDQARQMENRNRAYEREMSYRNAVQELKRMVEAERRTSRANKQHMNALLQARTELEVLLQHCLDDVKSEIARHQAEEDKGGLRLPGAEGAEALSVHDLSAQDRERVLELLLSQKRVVELLYSKTFPSKPPEIPQEEERKDDFAWLGDIIPLDK